MTLKNKKGASDEIQKNDLSCFRCSVSLPCHRIDSVPNSGKRAGGEEQEPCNDRVFQSRGGNDGHPCGGNARRGGGVQCRSIPDICFGGRSVFPEWPDRGAGAIQRDPRRQRKRHYGTAGDSRAGYSPADLPRHRRQHAGEGRGASAGLILSCWWERNACRPDRSFRSFQRKDADGLGKDEDRRPVLPACAGSDAGLRDSGYFHRLARRYLSSRYIELLNRVQDYVRDEFTWSSRSMW